MDLQKGSQGRKQNGWDVVKKYRALCELIAVIRDPVFSPPINYVCPTQKKNRSVHRAC